MRILICGDREWEPWEQLHSLLTTYPKGTIVIEGEARGVDSTAREVALELGMQVEKYPAKWDEYGKAAGVIRNREMLMMGKPDKVIGFHQQIEKSKGTKDMLSIAMKKGIPIELIEK